MSATRQSLQRFIIIGFSAMLIHYIAMRFALGLGAPLVTANAVGFCTSIMFSYFGNRYFVFTGKSSHAQSFALVLLGYALTWIVQTAFLVGFTTGSLYGFFNESIAPVGQIIAAPWRMIAEMINTRLPQSSSSWVFVTTPDKLSLNAAFIIATGIQAVLTYFWNRIVVYKMRPSPL